MLWGSLFILLLLLLIYLLTVPVELFINTANNTYYLRLKWLAKANLEVDEKEIVRVKLRIATFDFYLYPLRKKFSRKQKPKSLLKKKKRANKLQLKRMLRLAKSFEVKKFNLDLDTGDNVSNPKLYPIFFLLNYTKGTFAINFDGRSQLILLVQNRPIRIIRSFFNF